MTPERAVVLSKAAAARSTNAMERARSALAELEHAGATITFAIVAAQARVSRQFLYSHPDLRADIEQRRGRQRVRLPAGERARDASLRVRLRTALDDNKRLRDEIAALRDELALAHGRVRELELAARATSAR